MNKNNLNVTGVVGKPAKGGQKVAKFRGELTEGRYQDDGAGGRKKAWDTQSRGSSKHHAFRK